MLFYFILLAVEEPVEKPVERVVHDPSKDNRTVFVSNLAFTTDAEKLKSFFASVGVISELRLVRDFKGRSKGYAYVVFDSHVIFAYYKYYKL